ncbi:MAG TPA: hypothetical protein VEH10_00035 [Thermoplasmata archaeon]|nr:hypothetical protein [Thermoplasmata archaeon]
MADDEDLPRRHWRGWHVIGRFFPMAVLGLIFILIGAVVPSLHRGHAYGILFVWIGAILIVFAILGMFFTKCPVCYRTHWVVCMQEPDVVRAPRHQSYHRELSFREEKE